MKNNILVFKRKDAVSRKEDAAGGSTVSFHEPFVLSVGTAVNGSPLYGRFVYIEVNDVDVGLHIHQGDTLVTVVSGSGVCRTKDGDTQLTEGDESFVPAGVPHLHVAAKGTVMAVRVIYLSEHLDPQDSIPI